MSAPVRLGVGSEGFQGWKRRRAPQPLPLRPSFLGIYSVPHRSGVVWAIVAIIVLAWSVNTANNMGILLGSILGVAGIYGSLMPAGRLVGLSLVSVHAEPVHAGSPVQLRLRFRSKRNPDGLMVEAGENFEPIVFNQSGTGEASLSVMAKERGVYSCPLLKISTRRPFGFSVAWMKMWPSGEIVVWPQPESSGPDCPGGLGQHQNQETVSRNRNVAQPEEWSWLREYRTGDRLRDMDWKRVARTGSYWVRQYDAPPGGHMDIRWVDTEGMPHEARIRRLARWILDAERQGRTSSLSLPAQTVPTGKGLLHRAQCLTALARLPHE